ncbi:MAG: hypothetical protein ABI678_08410, partial [Kofleriaceae bacterium]
QPESEIAQALHLDLAELRKLRTPVPMRPTGMARLHGVSQAGMTAVVPDDNDLDEPQATTPVPRMRTAEVFGDDESDAVPDLPVGGDPAWIASRALPGGAASPDGDAAWIAVDIQTPPKPLRAVTPLAVKVVREAAAAPQPIVDKPSIGAAYLARSQGPSRMPWLVAGILGLVVLALLAYIVIK